jgi:hypothetical protein
MSNIPSEIKTIRIAAKIALQKLVSLAVSKDEITSIITHINKLNKYIVNLEKELISCCCASASAPELDEAKIIVLNGRRPGLLRRT